MAKTQDRAQREEEEDKEDKEKKKQRANLGAIQKQLEFYFSNSNLRRDFHLQKLVAQHPYVSVHELLKFNRLKKLQATETSILKATSLSGFLAICTCCQKKIGRKVEWNILDLAENSEELNERVVYIQGIQKDATIESLSSYFSIFGTVLMVNIPRCQKESKNKGFAFIEFENKKAASFCLQSLERKLKRMNALKGKEVKNDSSKEDYDVQTLSYFSTKAEWEKKKNKAQVQTESKHGMILKLEGLDFKATYPLLHYILSLIAQPKFLDYVDGDHIAYARMKTSADALKVVHKVQSSGGLVVGNPTKLVNIQILSGQEELEYFNVEKVRIQARASIKKTKAKGKTKTKVNPKPKPIKTIKTNKNQNKNKTTNTKAKPRTFQNKVLPKQNRFVPFVNKPKLKRKRLSLSHSRSRSRSSSRETSFIKDKKNKNRTRKKRI